MAYFNVKYLSSEELKYELYIRGVKIAKGAPVEAKRKKLKSILDREDIDCEYEAPANTDWILEIDACQKKIQNLRITMAEFDGNNKSIIHDKIQTYLGHLLPRLHRLQPEEESLKTQVKDCITQTTALESEVDDKTNDFEMNLEALSRPNTTLNSSFATATTPSTSGSSTVRKCPQVYKWGLRFTGEGGQSITSFLQSVQELGQARGATHEQLFEAVYDLLGGRALVWFRSRKDEFSTWEQLEDGLRKEYLPPDYDLELTREISARKQGKNEPVGSFIACMRVLYSRLPKPPPEDERLRVIRHNLEPYFIHSLGLSKINTIDELLDSCKQLENNRYMAERQSQNERSAVALEPDLANRNIRASRSVNSSTRRQELNCWNCGEKGHVSLRCNKPRTRIFCYGCGAKGVTSRQCSACSGKDAART